MKLAWTSKPDSPIDSGRFAGRQYAPGRAKESQMPMEAQERSQLVNELLERIGETVGAAVASLGRLR
ncbi:MAG TPA: hypothetical protein VGP84_07425 [Gemmatimonadaceae bacterium]|nr:hypothetical protein [Gemmatimonadaceae bacterium]